MAIAFDAATVLGPGTGTLSATHTPVGTPRGVLILMGQNTGADTGPTATYGGVGVSELAESALLVDPGDEDGVLYGFFLGASVPTGAQTAQITVGSAENKYASVFTVTAATDTEVADVATFVSASQDEPTVDLVTPASVETFIAGIIHSGLPNLTNVTVPAEYTQVHTRDYGSQVSKTSRRTSNGSGGNVAYNWVTSAADDVGLFAVAVRESAAATAPILPRKNRAVLHLRDNDPWSTDGWL